MVGFPLTKNNIINEFNVAKIEIEKKHHRHPISLANNVSGVWAKMLPQPAIKINNPKILE